MPGAEGNRPGGANGPSKHPAGASTGRGGQSSSRPTSSSGNKALIFGGVATGVGLVLTMLGLAPATQEALPFGLGLFAFGLLFLVPGVRKLRRRLATAPEPEREAAPGAADGRPPSSVQCPNCRGPAPLSLAEPRHTTCAYCQHRFALAPELSQALERGAAAVQAQSEAERHIARSIEALAAREASWLRTMTRLSRALAAAAVPVFLYGWLTRADNSLWFAWCGWALESAGLVALLSLQLSRSVPAAMRRIVGRWTALKLPNLDALACRVCGGPLPSEHRPVLRCGWCSADNLAGADVLARVEASAAHAQAGRLAVGQRHAQSEELAAFAINAFVPLVLVGWFGLGAFAGSGFVNLGDLRIWVDGGARYALVRVHAGGTRACLATMREVEGGTELRFDHDKKVVVSPERLGRVSVRAPVPPSWLEGQELLGGRKVEKVVRYLRYPARHMGRVEGSDLDVYFPSSFGGGEVTCLAQESSGEALELP